MAPYKMNITNNHTSQGCDPLGWEELPWHHIGRTSHITILLRDPLGWGGIPWHHIGRGTMMAPHVGRIQHINKLVKGTTL